MNFKSLTKLHKMLASRLGDDLVYSLALDEGEFFMAISVHKSNRVQYSHGRNIQTVHIDKSEMTTDVRKLVDKIVPMYNNILVEKKYEET